MHIYLIYLNSCVGCGIMSRIVPDDFHNPVAIKLLVSGI